MAQRKLEIPGKQKPYLMAHRGNRAACPENTLAAFRRALEDGADIIETDLHVTADGALVCIHDATVDRTTDGSGRVADMTLAEIKALSASYRRAGFAGERVPTLAEALALLPADVGIALELKADAFLDAEVCRRLVVALDDAGRRAQAVVLSFNMARIEAVRQVAPDLLRGYITLKRLDPCVPAEFVGPFWPLLLANPWYVAWAHRRGQLVCPLDPTPDARLWLYRALRCDAVLSDDPGATARALGR